MLESAQPDRIPPAAERYASWRAALLTQHGKEQAIAPVLEPALGCRGERMAGYDTDLLGTFTRDIPRAGTQLEAARRKARLGMELSGLPLGLASEGSFGPDPFTGTFSWNLEVIVWIDDTMGTDMVGVATGKTSFAHRLAAHWAEAEAFARATGFPEHHLVVRPQDEGDPRIRKGIADRDGLEEACRWACTSVANGRTFLETDMCAHANPTRMENIRMAAEDLTRKLSSLCPACGAPTRETRADVHGCLKCARRLTRERTDRAYADLRRCDYCNP